MKAIFRVGAVLAGIGMAHGAAKAEDLANVVYTFRDGETIEFTGNNVSQVSVENRGEGALQVRVVRHEDSPRTVLETLVGPGQAFTRTAGLGNYPYRDYTVYVTAKGNTTAWIRVVTD